MTSLRAPIGTGLSDPAALGVALGAWTGATVTFGMTPWLAGAVVLCAMWTRRSVLLIGAVVLLAGSLAQAQAQGADFVVTTGDFDAVAEVMTDPVRIHRGTRLDVVFDGRRYEVIGFGPQGAELRDRLVGERVELAGTVRPVRYDTWAGRRGVVGAISVSEVRGHQPASGRARLANEFRALLERGSASMTIDDQALFLGIVYGDDRDLSALIEDDFRAAGLTHLVAVSGQNVAFVLMVVAPLLRRLGPWARWVAILFVLMLFGTITRFEPSVMRSVAMAGVAATATALGREATAVRTLSLAVAGLVLLDPSLVHQLGFQLSVAATAGILWMAPRIARVVPGPRPFREALGVTAGAQLAVAPMLVVTFGGVPAASIPANLLAGPASGPVMIWGLTGGVLAGLAPARLAALLHWPTQMLVGWLRLVARTSAQVPLGQIDMVALLGGGAILSLLLAGGNRRTAGWAAVALMALPSLVFAVPPRGRFELGSGLVAWRGDTVVVEIGEGARIATVLPALRNAGVGDIDVVVVASGADSEVAAARAVDARHRVGATWSPGHFAPGAEIVVGALTIRRLDTDGEARLVVLPQWAPP